MEAMCIPLGGNIPRFGNSVCILFISSEQVGTFKLDNQTLIKVLRETF